MSADNGTIQAKISGGSTGASEQRLDGAGKKGRRSKGSLQDFASGADEHAEIVYWLAWFITEDNEDAEDVLQRTFLKAHSDFAQFQQSKSSITWLLRIAVNESFAKLRNRDAGKLLRLNLEMEADVAFAPQEVVDWRDEAEQRYTSEELGRIVRDEVQSLTPFSRTVFLLRDVAKLKTEEIADLFHLPVPSVRSHSLRSRLQLREHLNKYFNANVKQATQTA